MGWGMASWIRTRIGCARTSSRGWRSESWKRFRQTRVPASLIRCPAHDDALFTGVARPDRARCALLGGARCRSGYHPWRCRRERRPLCRRPVHLGMRARPQAAVAVEYPTRGVAGRHVVVSAPGHRVLRPDRATRVTIRLPIVPYRNGQAVLLLLPRERYSVNPSPVAAGSAAWPGDRESRCIDVAGDRWCSCAVTICHAESA